MNKKRQRIFSVFLLLAILIMAMPLSSGYSTSARNSSLVGARNERERERE